MTVTNIHVKIEIQLHFINVGFTCVLVFCFNNITTKQQTAIKGHVLEDSDNKYCFMICLLVAGLLLF